MVIACFSPKDMTMTLFFLLQLGILHPPVAHPDVMSARRNDLAMGLHPLCYHSRQQRLHPCGVRMPEGKRDA